MIDFGQITEIGRTALTKERLNRKLTSLPKYTLDKKPKQKKKKASKGSKKK